MFSSFSLFADVSANGRTSGSKERTKIRFASVDFIVDVHDAERLLDSVLGLIRQGIRKECLLYVSSLLAALNQIFETSLVTPKRSLTSLVAIVVKWMNMS
jgi:hypothetical protein